MFSAWCVVFFYRSLWRLEEVKILLCPWGKSSLFCPESSLQQLFCCKHQFHGTRRTIDCTKGELTIDPGGWHLLSTLTGRSLLSERCVDASTPSEVINVSLRLKTDGLSCFLLWSLPQGIKHWMQIRPFSSFMLCKNLQPNMQISSHLIVLGGQLWAWYQTISFIWNITTEIIVFLPKMKISDFFFKSHWGGKVLLPLTHFLEEKRWPWRRKAREKVCTNKYRIVSQ